MIRYSNSLFFSILLHVILLSSVYVVYKSFSSDKTYTDNKATIKLCNVVSEKYVEVIKPKGAFYIFPSFKAILQNRGLKSFEFSEKLLDEAKVATVPGVEFGCEYHLRLSFAASMEDLEKGVERIKSFIEKL